MANTVSERSAKISKKAPTKRVAAKAAKPGKAVASSSDHVSASKRIDQTIAGLGDWRGARLAEIRKLIHQAEPEVVEEWKWGVPVWSHPQAGIVCTGETYKKVVKMTFAKGASLADPSGLFNSSLQGNTRRAIDLHEGDKIDEKALKALVCAAAGLNTLVAKGRSGGVTAHSSAHLRSRKRSKSA